MQRKLKTILSTRTVIASMALAMTATAFSQPYPTQLLDHEQQITKIIEGMMKMKDSYNVSMLTQVLALASLRDPGYFEKCVNEIKANREVLAEGLRNLSFGILPSETNFLFVRPPKNAKKYFEDLKLRNIVVRYFPMERTCNYVRITVGSAAENAALLKATGEILSR